MEECFNYKEITLGDCIVNENNFNFICDGDSKKVTMTHKEEE